MGLGAAIARSGLIDEDLGQASSVEVHERMGETTTYRIRYEVHVGNDDLPLLADGRLQPGSQLSILVPVKGTVHCLVKGPVVGQQIHLQHGDTGSWLDVRGADASVEMDREARSAIWSDVTDGNVVMSILTSNYPGRFAPDVQDTAGTHLESKHALVQRDSDLRFIRRLAERNGCLFWITSNVVGPDTAHFKTPPLGGQPAVELTLNRESPSLRSFEVGFDVERPTSVQGAQLDLNTKSDLVGAVASSPQTSLGTASLAQITNDTRSVFLSAPADDAGDLQARGQGLLTEADWFVRASCQASLFALGKLVRTHTVARVRGAGRRHDGPYFVAAVRHLIDAARHRMDIELVRNGWGG